MEASEALTYPATGAAMVRPRQVLSRQQRGEEKAASKADGGKTQAADAARYGPARAPRPEARLRAWRLASGDDSSEAATRPIVGAGPEQRWAHESAMRKKRGTHARAAGAKHMYVVLTNADDWSNR